MNKPLESADIDIDKLIAKLSSTSEKATQGDWIPQCFGFGPIRIQTGGPDFKLVAMTPVEANAEHIGVASPKNIKVLIAELERYRNYAKQRDEENKDLMLTIGRLRVEREEPESRQLSVKLPTPYPIGYGIAADKYNFAIEECAQAIRAAGGIVEGGE